jgi:integrase
MVATAQETNPVLASALVIAAVTGARQGEMCALRSSHIDWDDHVIVYEESLTFQAKGTSLGPTKTHQHRKVAMDSILEAHLRPRRGWCPTP